MSGSASRPAQAALAAVSVAMAVVATALGVVVVKGAQVEAPLTLCAALFVLAAARHTLTRDRA